MNIKKIIKYSLQCIPYIAHILMIFAYYGINANKLNNIMSSNWVIDATKWSLWVSMFWYSAITLYKTDKKIKNDKNTIDEKEKKIVLLFTHQQELIDDLNSKILDIEASNCRCFANVHRDDPEVSFIWWIRALEKYYDMQDKEFIRMSLSSACEAAKKIEYRAVFDVNEINTIISKVKDDIYKNEIDTLYTEIKRLT